MLGSLANRPARSSANDRTSRGACCASDWTTYYCSGDTARNGSDRGTGRHARNVFAQVA